MRNMRAFGLLVSVVLLVGCSREGESCTKSMDCWLGLQCFHNVCMNIKRTRLRALSMEASESLDKIKAGARQYYIHDHWDSNGNQLPKGFPTGIKKTPPKPSCYKTFTTKTSWDSAGWGPLHFALTEPHMYSYSFESSGTGTDATYTARAHGDLDCDGVISTWEIRGSVDTEGSVKIVGPIISNELE